MGLMPPGDSPAEGPEGAPVRVVLFVDFAGEHSAKTFDAFEKIVERRSPSVRLVVKQFPLVRKHPRALAAARAAIAAALQGKFWPYARALFEHRSSLDDATLERLAGQVGLDLDRWRKDRKGSVVKVQLDADLALALKFGVTTTPTAFINGRRVVGSRPEDELFGVVDEELYAARHAMALGVATERVADVVTDARLLAPQGASGGGAPARKAAQREDPNRIYPIAWTGENLAMGASPEQALVTMVVFFDYQCPFCARLEPTVQSLLAAHPKELRVIYRHLPLAMHKHAKLAAEAVQAARDQGRQLDYHRRLVEHRSELTEADLVRHALELGLDVTRFERALREHRHRAVVERDAAEAAKYGITGTPTSIINGRKVVGAKPFDRFEAVIQAEIERARRVQRKTGLKGRALYLRLVGAKPSS